MSIRKFRKDQPTYFVADIAANHDGELSRAKELIHLAAQAGADAAKFQNFQAARIVSDYGFRNLHGKLSHQKSWSKSVFEVYEDASIPKTWTLELKKACAEAGIDYFTSPYDVESVDFVDSYVDLYKIGSGDITWLEIIEHIASKGKPVLLATGASDLDDVKRAMTILQASGVEIVLMQCNTNYTGSLENFRYVNLRVLNTYSWLYPDVVLGLSDHTLGHAAVLGAVALGARVVEKHFTDDTGREGPDHKFSMEPAAWREMVDRVRELEHSLGDGQKRIEANESQTVVVQRRCLRATRDIDAGEVITPRDMESLRPCPADGYQPYEASMLEGRVLQHALKEGEHFTPSHFAHDKERT